MYEKTKTKIKQLLAENVFSGVNASFITGKQIERLCLGEAQTFPYSKKMTPSLLFDVASLTKVICTTTVVLQLIEKELLELDRPIKSFYPAIKDERITVRHLLTHTANITSYIPDRESLTKEELRAAYLLVESGDKLGKEVSYTDTGTILLGFILEEVLHKNVTDIFEEHVLTPLGMEESCFFPDAPENIVPTENHPTRGLIHGQTHDPKAFVLAEHAGNAGLFTNLPDLEKFTFMYLNQGQLGEKRFLKNETIHKLLTDCTPDGTGNRSLGWDLKTDIKSKNNVLFHTGYTGTFMLLDPTDLEGFLFLSNRVHPYDHRNEYIEKRDELIDVYLKEKSEH